MRSEEVGGGMPSVARRDALRRDSEALAERYEKAPRRPIEVQEFLCQTKKLKAVQN